MKKDYVILSKAKNPGIAAGFALAMTEEII